MIKKELRKKVLKIRRDLGKSVIREESDAILKHLLCSPFVEDAKVIMCYLAMEDEVQLMNFIAYALKKGKSICVPHIRDKAGLMDAVKIESLDKLVSGEFGILTVDNPDIKIMQPNEIDLVIVPGVAFDKQGHRLGMGAGFYDRFLLNVDQADFVGVALSCQIVDFVPSMVHDCLVDYIITKDGIINCKTGKM